MTDDVVIRAATVHDAVALKHCMISAYSAYEDRLEGAPLPPMELDYAEEITSYPTWVATLNGQVIGGLTMMFAENHASIANIAVSPAAQGHGLGRQLLAFAEAKTKEKDLHEARLATHVLLTENVGFYSHLGWSEYDRDDTRIYMRKEIS